MIMMSKPAETAELNSWDLMDSRELGILIGTQLGPFHVGDSCVARTICRALGAGSVPGA